MKYINNFGIPIEIDRLLPLNPKYILKELIDDTYLIQPYVAFVLKDTKGSQEAISIEGMVHRNGLIYTLNEPIQVENKLWIEHLKQNNSLLFFEDTDMASILKENAEKTIMKEESVYIQSILNGPYVPKLAKQGYRITFWSPSEAQFYLIPVPTTVIINGLELSETYLNEIVQNYKSLKLLASSNKVYDSDSDNLNKLLIKGDYELINVHPILKDPNDTMVNKILVDGQYIVDLLEPVDINDVTSVKVHPLTKPKEMLKWLTENSLSCNVPVTFYYDVKQRSFYTYMKDNIGRIEYNDINWQKVFQCAYYNENDEPTEAIVNILLISNVDTEGSWLDRRPNATIKGYINQTGKIIYLEEPLDVSFSLIENFPKCFC